MTFLTGPEIKEWIVKKKKLFKEKTYDLECVETGSVMYDLRLGEEVFVTPRKEPRRLKMGDTVSIGPGQFAVLTTEEYLLIPEDFFAFITIRFRYKKKGLVNISGFHVDPGFKGYLIFSVYNAGPTTLTLRRGEPVFSIFFYRLSKAVKPKERKIEAIETEIIESLAGARVPSLENLERKVSRNETILTTLGTILTGMIVGLFVALLSGVL